MFNQNVLEKKSGKNVTSGCSNQINIGIIKPVSSDVTEEHPGFVLFDVSPDSPEAGRRLVRRHEGPI